MNVRPDHLDSPTTNPDSANAPRSRLIDWFAEGQAVAVEFEGIVITMHYLGRKGRRARIAITGPAGAVYRALDLSETAASPDRSA